MKQLSKSPLNLNNPSLEAPQFKDGDRSQNMSILLNRDAIPRLIYATAQREGNNGSPLTVLEALIAGYRPIDTTSSRIFHNEQLDCQVMAFCREKGIVYQVFGLFDEGNVVLLEHQNIRSLSGKLGITPNQALLRLLYAEARSTSVCS